MSARLIGAACARSTCGRPARQHGICMLCWLGASQLERRVAAWDSEVGCSVVEEAERIVATLSAAPAAQRSH